MLYIKNKCKYAEPKCLRLVNRPYFFIKNPAKDRTVIDI